MPTSAERVFAALVDWDHQGQWMLGTRVWATGPGITGDLGRNNGAKVSAFTGIGRVGFLDTMVITNWDEPHRVDVAHTGRVVRGTGTMLVEALDTDHSRFIWSDDLHLPLGALGRLGWPLVSPFFAIGIKSSLKRFAQFAARPDTP